MAISRPKDWPLCQRDARGDFMRIKLRATLALYARGSLFARLAQAQSYQLVSEMIVGQDSLIRHVLTPRTVVVIT